MSIQSVVFHKSRVLVENYNPCEHLKSMLACRMLNLRFIRREQESERTFLESFLQRLANLLRIKLPYKVL